MRSGRWPCWSPVPARFDIAPGATKAVTLSLTLAGARPDAYTAGAIVLTNTADRRTVRLPVSAKPVKLDAAPRLEIVAQAADGAAPLPLRAGFDGTLTALGRGLAPSRLAKRSSSRRPGPISPIPVRTSAS